MSLETLEVAEEARHGICDELHRNYLQFTLRNYGKRLAVLIGVTKAVEVCFFGETDLQELVSDRREDIRMLRTVRAIEVCHESAEVLQLMDIQ